MKERPILFNAKMVRAILDGSKTQTRRVVKHKKDEPPAWATFAQPMSNLQADGSCKESNFFRWSEEQAEGKPLISLRRWPGNGPDLVYDWYAIPCPYGQVGDRLWVRETFREGCTYGGDYRTVQYLSTKTAHVGDKDHPVRHVMAQMYGIADSRSHSIVEGGSWRPSIHMPRWASRITLEITGVRVERLQDISDEDAKSEGATRALDPIDFVRLGAIANHKTGFQILWESINGHESWDANPWVWVIEFKRV
jgi:hypothetical protein